MLYFAILNGFFFTLLVRRHGVAAITLPVGGYFVAVLFGLIGTVLTLDGSDWWLMETSSDSIELAALLYNASLALWASALLVQKPVRLDAIHINPETSGLIPPALFGISILSLLVICAVFLPDSPLAHLVVNRDVSPLVLAELRGGFNQDFTGTAIELYFKNLVLRYVLPYITIYFYLSRLSFNKSRIYFPVCFAITLLGLSLDLSKAPIISVFLLLVVGQVFAGSVSVRKLAIIGGVSMLLLAALYIFVMGADEDVAAEIAHRAFVAQYVGFPVAVEVFPRIHSYIDLGSTLGQLGKLFGYDYVFYSRITMEFAYPEGVRAGTAGYLSTFAGAEGYAIGGVLGYCVVTTAVIAFLFLIDWKFARRRDLRWRAFYAFLLWKVPLLVMDSASAMVINYGLLLVYLLIKLLEVSEPGRSRRWDHYENRLLAR